MTALRAWLVGAAAALLSLVAAWVPSYWTDEVATLRAARLAPGALIHFTTRHVDAAQTLYYLAMHVWTAVFGFSELATRSFSALGVGVAVALVALIGRRLDRPRLGYLAAVLLAVMPRLTWAGAEARPYAWTAAVAAAAWLVLLIALERGGWWWVLLGGIAAVSIALFLLSATLLFAQLGYVLVRPQGGRRGRRGRAVLPLLAVWLAALVVTGPVLYLGWSERAQIAWLAHEHAFTPWTVLAEPWGESSWAYGIAFWIVLLAGALRWRDALRRACPAWLLLGACWAGVPLVMTVGASLAVTPVFSARYLTFAMPGAAMLLAAAVAALPAPTALPRRWLSVAAVVALIAIAAPTFVAQRMPDAKPDGEELRRLAQTVAAHSAPGDGIVFGPGRARKALAAYPEAFAGLDDIALGTPFPASGRFVDTTVPLRERADRLAGLPAVVLVVRGSGSSCTASADARTLASAGFTATHSYRTLADRVCRFTHG